MADPKDPKTPEAKPPEPAAEADTGFEMPTEKTPARSTVDSLLFYLYGVPKIGKTAMLADAEGALFLPFEPGHRHVSIFRLPKDHDIKSWDEFLSIGRSINKAKREGKFPFKLVVIDTFEEAYQLCRKYILAKNGLQHESDMGFGKGYDLVYQELRRVLRIFANIGCGVGLVGHDTEKDVEDYFGKKVTKSVPDITRGARAVALGLVDVIFFASYAHVVDVDDPDGQPRIERVLRTKPAPEYEAGDRTGRLPDPLPLSWKAVVEAFATGTTTIKIAEPAKVAEPEVSV